MRLIFLTMKSGNWTASLAEETEDPPGEQQQDMGDLDPLASLKSLTYLSLARGSCIPDCEPGTYFDSELIRCGQCHPTCKTCVGPSREECIHCASSLHFRDWTCVPACGEGYYPEAMPGLPHRVCRRWDENCLSCKGSSRNCSRCRAGLTQLGASCVANHTCSNADETFCEMVKSNRLCERKLFTQFCYRTCLRAG